jgi:hypothetical protein
VLGGLVQPHLGQLLLEGEHGGERKLRDRHRAGTAGAGEDGRREHLLRGRVHAGAEVVHPVHAPGQLSRGATTSGHSQERVAHERRVHVTFERHFHDLDLGEPLLDPRRALTVQLVEESHGRRL